MNVRQLRRALKVLEDQGMGLLETDAKDPRVVAARVNQPCLREGFVQSGIVGKWVRPGDLRLVEEAEALEIRDVPAWISIT
jgi:hypothetical protein